MIYYLKKYYDNMVNDGIIESVPIWLSDTTINKLNKAYYYNSGRKQINDFIEELNVTDETAEEIFIEEVAPIIDAKREEIDRLYKALVISNYDPISNYHRVEDTTNSVTLGTSQSYSGTDKVIGTGEDKDITESKVNGFNGGVSDRDTLTYSHKSGAGYDTQHGKTITGSGTDRTTIKSTIDGNIGVTTNQQMINEEIKLRRDTGFNKLLFGFIDDVIASKTLYIGG